MAGRAVMLSFRRTLNRKSVVVNLHSSRAFVGILWARRGPLIVLRNVVMHEPGAQASPVDGEIVIERSQIEFIQVTG
jgi:small nuclear ribonucleoprotein (snRNP)-like protein